MSDYENDIDDELLALAGEGGGGGGSGAGSEKKRKRRAGVPIQASSSSSGAVNGSTNVKPSKKRKQSIDQDNDDLTSSRSKKSRSRDVDESAGRIKSRHDRDNISYDEDDEDGQMEDEGGDDTTSGRYTTTEAQDPYPLEGKYVDEADRTRLLQMAEFEREDIITQRLEEKQRLQDSKLLAQLVNQQRTGGSMTDMDSVSKAAKREHAVRGATKEKAKRLDELKAKRKAKGEKLRTKNSPKRERSSSPMDMETSDEEEEDGQISKLEQEEERERKMFGDSPTSGRKKAGQQQPPEEETPATLEDMNKYRVTRDLIAKHCMAPWFSEFVSGSYVRYLIGSEHSEAVYRICEVVRLSPETVKPYKVNDRLVNQTLELKHGNSTRSFTMDKISNSLFLPKEFERMTKVWQTEEVKMPSKQALEKHLATRTKLVTQPMTESDINEMLRRKNELSNVKRTGQSTTMERSRLNQAKTLAQRRQDYAEVAEIEKQLAELAAATALISTADGGESAPGTPQPESKADMLARVNERNRKANMEAVRKAELAETERKRRERKLAMQAQNGAGRSGSSTPHPPADPSARLRIVPRTFNAAPNTSRPTTPAIPGSGATTKSPLNPSAETTTPLAHPRGQAAKSFSALAFDAVEVDLGDF